MELHHITATKARELFERKELSPVERVCYSAPPPGTGDAASSR